jgi:hypothetical protein
MSKCLHFNEKTGFCKSTGRGCRNRLFKGKGYVCLRNGELEEKAEQFKLNRGGMW